MLRGRWTRPPSGRGSSPGDRRARAQTDRRHARLAHAAGSPIARLAADGNTNREIRGAALHQPEHGRVPPRKAFRKLDVEVAHAARAAALEGARRRRCGVGRWACHGRDGSSPRCAAAGSPRGAGAAQTCCLANAAPDRAAVAGRTLGPAGHPPRGAGPPAHRVHEWRERDDVGAERAAAIGMALDGTAAAVVERDDHRPLQPGFTEIGYAVERLHAELRAAALGRRAVGQLRGPGAAASSSASILASVASSAAYSASSIAA